MSITVEFVGERTQEVDPDGETYADLLAPFDVSKHEVSVLVDGQPVPEDKALDEDVETVQIVRLIQGG
jgi:sulfur carrier protein